MSATPNAESRNSTDQLLLYHNLIDGIVAAIEARDPYTSYHSLCVAGMTEKISEKLSITEEQAVEFHIAAHLHDLGKIGIDDSVLRKEGPLNAEEWNRIKEHPVIGYNILMKIDSFAEIAKIVLHHHERWDGKGYPDGCAQENIPLGARIIAVADSIDAMMSDRAYRRGMKPELCRAEIEHNAGIMYDPAVVSATMEHWKEIINCRNATARQRSIQNGMDHQ